MIGYQVGVIGAGNMASAILTGALRRGVVRGENVWLSNPHEGKLEPFRAKGVRVSLSNARVAGEADILVLAVKPQVFDRILPEIAPFVKEKCVVSIAAGISTAFLSAALPGAHVIRAMPNTPLLIGKGVTALSPAEGVPQPCLDAVVQLFRAAGEVVLVEEAQLDGVTALSGSSPAYFFRLAQAMVRQGERLGLEEELALRLTALTMEGAAGMLLGSGKSPGELTAQVCSPGGTTLAALSAFDEAGLEEMVAQAMQRCVARARELRR